MPKERVVVATYLVYDDPTWPNRVWIDMPEAEPRTRVRLAADSTDSVNVTVYNDGSFEADGTIETDTTYGKQGEDG